MFRPTLLIVLVLTSSTSLTGCLVDRDANAQAAATSAADRIADAMSAAPPAIAQHATIMDRPASPDAPPQLLRAGNNGWTCTPSIDAALEAGQPNPSCVDEQAQSWFEARPARQMPQLGAVGFNYKLMGDNGASNIDPYANGPTPDIHWVVTAPHIIIFVPNVADLASLPSDPESGGPYVMWQGTPYAHVMVPVAAPPNGALQER